MSLVFAGCRLVVVRVPRPCWGWVHTVVGISRSPHSVSLRHLRLQSGRSDIRKVCLFKVAFLCLNPQLCLYEMEVFSFPSQSLNVLLNYRGKTGWKTLGTNCTEKCLLLIKIIKYLHLRFSGHLVCFVIVQSSQRIGLVKDTCIVVCIDPIGNHSLLSCGSRFEIDEKSLVWEI